MYNFRKFLEPLRSQYGPKIVIFDTWKYACCYLLIQKGVWPVYLKQHADHEDIRQIKRP